MLLMMVVIFGIMWFFMIRPQQKKQKEEQKMRNNLRVGDELTTIGGVKGRVVSIKDGRYCIDKGLAKCIPARYSDLISLNKAAIEEGMKSVEIL